MIPISDDNPVRLTPFVTWALILACVFVYGWEISLGGRGMDSALNVLGFTPGTLLRSQSAPSELMGVPPVATIFIAMFLHGSILHLAGNMLYLWIFGNNIEDAMGHLRFILFYFISGVAAAMTMAFMDPASSVPMIGASGAISGVLGAYMLLYPRARVTVILPLGIIFYPFRIAAVWVVGLWFLTQLVTAALTNPNQPGVAWWAHVGGFLAGLVLTPLLKSSGVPYFGPVYRRGPWN
jgi:membrane associated rhomboid family serine protease